MISDVRRQVRRAICEVAHLSRHKVDATADRLESLHLSNLSGKEGGRLMSDML